MLLKQRARRVVGLALPPDCIRALSDQRSAKPLPGRLLFSLLPLRSRPPTILVALKVTCSWNSGLGAWSASPFLLIAFEHSAVSGQPNPYR